MTDKFSIWKMVWVGERTRDWWLSELEAGRNWLSIYAKSMIARPEFVMLDEKTEIELIRAEVQHLGFTDENELPTTADILLRAKQLGFSTDIQEAGLVARLVAKDDDCFSVISDPIPDCDNYPNVFYSYQRRAGRRLGAHDARPLRQWDLDGELVLVRRKHPNS